MSKVMCPLMNEEIEDAVCFDIHMVAEGEAPSWTAPEKAVKVDGFKQKCLECPNHRDD